MSLSAFHIITVEELKRHLFIKGPAKDALLEEIVNESTEDWEAEWGRHIISRGTALVPLTEYHTMEAGDRAVHSAELRPRNWPIIDIISIHEDSSRAYGAATLLVAGTDYEIVRGQRDFIRRIDGYWSTGTRAIKIVGRFGYATAADVPARIKARVKELAALKWREIERQAQGVSSTGDALGNYTRFGAARITDEMRAASQAEYRIERYETGEAA